MGNTVGSIVFLPWIQALLILALVYLAYIDLRTFRLPDAITLPLILSGLLFNGLSQERLVFFQDSVIGVILGYFSLWLLNFIYRQTKKQNGLDDVIDYCHTLDLTNIIPLYSGKILIGITESVSAC